MAPNQFERVWTDKEIVILTKYYSDKSNYKNKRGIELGPLLKLLPKKTVSQIKFKVTSLGLSLLGEARAKFTKEEDDLIREYYHKDLDYVISILKNRTIHSIRWRASRLGVSACNRHRGSAYTEEEDNILRKYYPLIGPDVYKMLNNRSVSSVCFRASEVLGVKFNRKEAIKFSKCHDDKILEEFSSIGADGLKEKYYELFAGKSVYVIIDRAYELGLCDNYKSTYTLEEDNLIRKYYPIMGTSMFNMIKGRSRRMVGDRAKRLGVKYNNGFTQEQDDLIIKEYSRLGGKIITAYPDVFNGKTADNLHQRARVLGVKFARVKKSNSKLPDKVRCIETGKTYKNVNRAIIDTGHKNLRYVINKGKADKDGNHWEIINI